MHHGEALRTFNVLALSPALPLSQKRVRTYAALYMGEDPHAPNYDPQHKINARDFTVQLAPGAGAKLTQAMKRYADPPTARFPWDR